MDHCFGRRKYHGNFIWLITWFIFSGCTQQAEKKALPPPSFKKVWGIHYTEVRRCFKSGYSFSHDGYQIIPDWRLSFPSDDSVNIWNPNRGLFVNAPVTFDHDSVFNVAWSWLRLKKLAKDSIVFQVLRVRDKVINNEKSIVYMTLYADDYIKNVLHTDAEILRRPDHADTAFIKRRADEANADRDKAFPAIHPVQLISRSPLVTVERVAGDTGDQPSDQPPADYLLPEFNISIRKAYDNFQYSFTAWVDANGSIIFRRSVISIEPEFKEAYLRAMKGIVNGYLKAYLQTIPGNTLGMPHTSIIIINVTGIK